MLRIGTGIPATRIPHQRLFHEERRWRWGSHRRRSSIEMGSAIKHAAIPPPRPLMLTSGTSRRVDALLSVVSLRTLRSLLLLLNGFILLLILPFRRRTVVVSAVERSPAAAGEGGEEVSGAMVVRSLSFLKLVRDPCEAGGGYAASTDPNTLFFFY